MARRQRGKRPTRGSYSRRQLRRALCRHLPRRGLSLRSGKRSLRWTDRLLVICAMLICFSPAPTLCDRFAEAAAGLSAMYPGRRRPGKVYAGFAATLARHSDRLLRVVAGHLRRSLEPIAGDRWAVGGWVAFGVDGSKIDCPMTGANEEAFGLASRRKSWPQMVLTTVFHVGTGVPWAFLRGPARSSERSHLLEMLKTLPGRSMVLADAGFTGYDVMSRILSDGHAFVIRVGSNVRLLTKLGVAVEERGGTVYLWPDARRKKRRPPLVLRLITVVDGRNRAMHLLTSVTDPSALSDEQAVELYKRRWLVEVLYRSLKQTLGRRKVLSDSPRHAEVELDWSVASLWVLSVELAESTPGRASVAGALRAVRQALAGRGGNLAGALAAASTDGYVRKRPKKARHWPNKKREKPPGAPKARPATDSERALAQELTALSCAA